MLCFLVCDLPGVNCVWSEVGLRFFPPPRPSPHVEARTRPHPGLPSVPHFTRSLLHLKGWAGGLCGPAPGPTRMWLALLCSSPAPWPWPGLMARQLRGHLQVCPGPVVTLQAGLDLELGFLSTLPVTLSATLSTQRWPTDHCPLPTPHHGLCPPQCLEPSGLGWAGVRGSGPSLAPTPSPPLRLCGF